MSGIQMENCRGQNLASPAGSGNRRRVFVRKAKAGPFRKGTGPAFCRPDARAGAGVASGPKRFRAKRAEIALGKTPFFEFAPERANRPLRVEEDQRELFSGLHDPNTAPTSLNRAGVARSSSVQLKNG